MGSLERRLEVYLLVTVPKYTLNAVVSFWSLGDLKLQRLLDEIQQQCTIVQQSLVDLPLSVCGFHRPRAMHPFGHCLIPGWGSPK